MSAPSTRAASSALRAGSTKARPSCEARQVIASAPRTGRRSPVSDSSPANSYLGRSCVSSWRDAASMPSAIGRSKRPLSLRSSAGARLTVMRRAGNSKRELTSAARTRSRLSFTSVSGRPTMVNEGNPFARCTSTITSGALSPARARLWSTASDTARLLLLQPRLEFDDAPLQLGELLARARGRLCLHLELLARRQIEPGERRGEQGLEVLLQVLRGARGEELADPRAQIFKQGRLRHLVPSSIESSTVK